MHDAPMRIGMQSGNGVEKLCRRARELPLRRAPPLGLALLCALAAVALSLAPRTGAAETVSARSVRLEFLRTAALLRRQMRRLPDDSGVVAVREPDRLILRVPARLLFAPDSVTMLTGRDAATVLAVMAQPLKRRSRLTAQVVVYTDSIGGASLNDSLSAERAAAIGTALRAAGVAAERFQVRGAGAASALVGNETATGRMRNRRIEMVFEYATRASSAPVIRPAPATGHAGG